MIISFNEEEKIEKALNSLQSVADEIVVVDSFSQDATPEICHRYTDRVFQRRWQGFRSQKEFATDRASYDWVLSLDADEVLGDALREEILEWKQADHTCLGYYLPRKTFFMGRWIKHTTWYPDWQLRLFRKSCGCWVGGRVHEAFRIKGLTARFRGDIHHYTYASLSEYLEQLKVFSTLCASDYWDRGRRAHLVQLLFYPPAVFLNNYFLKLGVLDGRPGLVVSLLGSVSALFKYLKLWELQRKKGAISGPSVR